MARYALLQDLSCISLSLRGLDSDDEDYGEDREADSCDSEYGHHSEDRESKPSNFGTNQAISNLLFEMFAHIMCFRRTHTKPMTILK